ncbi:hypothetical protein [Phascolarctobacterium faecium]|nr:hypothetical protein [Phascolarctobacterium faecium]
MGKTLHFAKKSLKIFSVVVSAALPYVFLEVHRNTFLFGQYFCGLLQFLFQSSRSSPVTVPQCLALRWVKRYIL